MSLYRKYRPQTFEDVVGQDHVAHTLRNALGTDPVRIAHAYLFCGPRGTGKTTSARLLAKCLNCEQGPTSTPCNECDFCVRVSTNQSVMDLIETDAASNRGIDNVRELIAGVGSAPAQGRYRIYIIDEVHMLTTEAFNALLKTLEEPPPHAIFVLATTDAHKVPTTITSRCQRFDFRRVGPRDIIGRLQYVAQSEGLELSAEAARLIADTADGALRDALTLLEQVSAFSTTTIDDADVRLVLGTVSRELIEGLMHAISRQDAVEILTHIENALDEGASFSQLTRDLVAYCRDLLLLTIGYEAESTLSDEQKQMRRQMADVIGRARLLATIEGLCAAEKEMRQSTDHRLLLELALVRAVSEPLPAQTQSTSAVPVPAGMVAPARTARPAITPRSAPPVSASPRPASMQTAVPPASAEQPAPEEKEPEAAAQEPATAAPAQPDTSASAPAPARKKRKGRRIHNMDEFRELWPAVLMRIRRRIGMVAVAYLHDAYPYALTPTTAVLEFQKEFHYAKACEEAKRHPFEQVLNECLDMPRRLEFRLAEPKPEPVKIEEPEPAAQHDEDDDENEEDEDIVAMTQQLFAAEIIEP